MSPPRLLKSGLRFQIKTCGRRKSSSIAGMFTATDNVRHKACGHERRGTGPVQRVGTGFSPR